jgi:hypothetical protein
MGYREIFQSLGEAFVPSGGPFEIGGGTADITGRFEFFVSSFGRKPFFTKIFLHLFNFLPILLFYKPRRFVSLSQEEKQKFLDRLRESRFFMLRGLYVVVRALVFLTFYSLKEVCDSIGYKAECEADEKNL